MTGRHRWHVYGAFISSFPHNRLQQMCAGKSRSALSTLCGVVQGSVISPLLIALSINDITLPFSDNKCTCKPYVLKCSRLRDFHKVS